MPRQSLAGDPWARSLANRPVGTYLLDEYIGSGKLGAVYRAHDTKIPERQVAIKLMSGLKAGWENEIRKAALLTNIPAVVQFHGMGTCDLSSGNRTELFQYTVWDYIAPGRNLKSYLAEKRTTTVSFLFAVVEQILLVLHACEKRGVPRHGDLHPGNILVGDRDEADLDLALRPRERIFVTDFGYGTTGGAKRPKDDYRGLAEIANGILQTTEWEAATASDRQRVLRLKDLVTKTLNETSLADRQPPLAILQSVRNIQDRKPVLSRPEAPSADPPDPTPGQMTVGQFQVSEMLGDEWEWWSRLFVASVPARSRILESGIATVVTGPRGCGKTMLFRRLSERLMLECGPIDDAGPQPFIGLYLNANDVADAFSEVQPSPTTAEAERIVYYANLCILSDFLAVLSSRQAKGKEDLNTEFASALAQWLLPDSATRPLVSGESVLERCRSILESIKWRVATGMELVASPSYLELRRHVWLPRFLAFARRCCPWIGDRKVVLLIDDFTTPRVSRGMQRALNRLFFQRSPEFISKIATESPSTFVAEETSGKLLQDGDDYQLIDLGEETLAMEESERVAFLDAVFRRRLALDARVPAASQDLVAFLGRLGLSKTEFARRLRGSNRPKPQLGARAKRRGATRPKVLYHGIEVFEALWSGDTRIMIQLVQELLDEAARQVPRFPIEAELQDRVLRARGGFWLEAQGRNQATDRPAVDAAVLAVRQSDDPNFRFSGGSYGTHLKAIVEAFVAAARRLLKGPTYTISEDGRTREVPRMAFRIEIVDEFRDRKSVV